MALAEALDVFLSDFGSSVSWSPSAGGATQTAVAIFEKPDENIMGERVRSRDYQLTLRSDHLQGCDTGETVVIASASYTVRESRQIDDGVFKIITLSKV